MTLGSRRAGKRALLVRRTGNPFSLGALSAGEGVVDVGVWKRAIDSLICRTNGWNRAGEVIGVRHDAMRCSIAARTSAKAGVFLQRRVSRGGPRGKLCLPSRRFSWAGTDGSSNRPCSNLFPDKHAGLQENVARCSNWEAAGGRLQLGEHSWFRKSVGENAKARTSISGRGETSGASAVAAELQATVVAAGFVGFEITIGAMDVYCGRTAGGSAREIRYARESVFARNHPSHTPPKNRERGRMGSAGTRRRCVVPWKRAFDTA
jgi:hypothetical protein